MENYIEIISKEVLKNNKKILINFLICKMRKYASFRTTQKLSFSIPALKVDFDHEDFGGPGLYTVSSIRL